MAEVTSYTQTKIDELVGALVASAAIDDSGNLTVTLQNGTVVPVGTVLESVPFASETVSGTVELASSSDISTGTDDSKAVTPLGLAGALSPINTAVAGKQAADTDLTAIAGLTPAANDILEYISGAWANRTPAQFAAVLAAAYPFLAAQLYNGSAYASATGALSYVGSVDPGSSAVNGSVWFDTSGS